MVIYDFQKYNKLFTSVCFVLLQSVELELVKRRLHVTLNDERYR